MIRRLVGVVTVAGILTATSWGRTHLRRFVVVDRSMEPTLREGQGLVAVRTSTARPGSLRCVEHPHHDDFWLVKRVESVTGSNMRVRSDNESVMTVDSRRFGPVPVSGSYAVLFALPLTWM